MSFLHVIGTIHPIIQVRTGVGKLLGILPAPQPVAPTLPDRRELNPLPFTV
jgi:hypothetical protein